MRVLAGALVGVAVGVCACTQRGVESTDQPARAATVAISPASSNAAEPAVLATSGGSYVAYVEHHGADGADLFVQKLGTDGKPAGERVRVNSQTDTVKAWYGDPPTIAGGKDGEIYVGWTRSYSDPDARGSDLMLSVSRDGGGSFAETKVNDDARPAAHGLHSLAVDREGRVIMAWLDERNVATKPHEMNMSGGDMHHDEAEPNSEVFTAFSDDGGRTFSANRLIAHEACPCCKTGLLAAADGNVYVTWRQVLEGDHRHIAVANSSDRGENFAQGVIVSNDNWQLHSCPVSGAVLASSEPGEIEVVWYTAGEAGPAGLYFSHSHDAGKTFSDRQLVSDQVKSGTPAFVYDKSGALVAMQNRDGGVSILRLADHGAAATLTSIPAATTPSAAVAGGPTLLASTTGSKEHSGIMVTTVGVRE